METIGTKLIDLNDDLLTINLPQGMTMEEINKAALKELNDMKTAMFGKDIKVYGRCTTALAMLLGHELAHVTKSVSIFDPKENEYITVIKH